MTVGPVIAGILCCDVTGLDSWVRDMLLPVSLLKRDRGVAQCPLIDRITSTRRDTYNNVPRRGG